METAREESTGHVTDDVIWPFGQITCSAERLLVTNTTVTLATRW